MVIDFFNKGVVWDSSSRLVLLSVQPNLNPKQFAHLGVRQPTSIFETTLDL